MKNILSLFLTNILLFSIISCKKQELKSEEKDPRRESIQGTWYQKSAIKNGRTEFFDNCKKKSTYTFFSAGNAQFTQYEYRRGECKSLPTEYLAYAISNTILALKNDLGEKKYKYTINRESLTLTDKNGIIITLKRQ